MASLVAYITQSPVGVGTQPGGGRREGGDGDATEPFPQPIGSAEAEMAKPIGDTSFWLLASRPERDSSLTRASCTSPAWSPTGPQDEARGVRRWVA